MKKICVVLCLILLTGCQHSMEVVTTNLGFQIDKIASISKDLNKKMMYYIYPCEENDVCFDIEYYEESKAEHYMIKSDQLSLVKRDLRPTINDQYVTSSNINVDDRETIYSISETEKIIAIVERINPPQSAKYTYIYQNGNETRFLYEYIHTYGEIENTGNTPYQGHVYMSSNRSVYFSFVENGEIVIHIYQAGNKMTEFRRIPLEKDGFTFIDGDISLNKTDCLIYQNETKKRLYYGEQMVEIELNEIAHLVDATHLIIQQVENQKVISNSIYDFESETKKEIGELLSHNIFSDYEWTGNSSNWIHVPEINRDSDSNQYFQLGKITENQIILTEIPFEVNRYLWAFMDDQHLIFVNNGEMDSSFDFYLVTLE